MKIADILKAVGIDEQSIVGNFQDRLDYEVMIREGDDPFLFHKLSIQQTGGNNRLVIQVGDRRLTDPWKG